MDNTNDLMKRCFRCGILYLKSSFHKNKIMSDGLLSCHVAYFVEKNMEKGIILKTLIKIKK